MKIGILTWYYGNNYGAKAHSFALQEVLKEMGHEVLMIRYSTKRSDKKNILMNLNTPNIKFHPCILAQCLNRCRKFDQWTKEHYSVSQRVFSGGEIDRLGCDAIIIGSDEVFNYRHPFFSELYYGVGIETPAITYAVSSGQASEEERFDKTVIASLEKIRSLSVRDYHTKKLLENNVSKDVSVVLDPTLLYDFQIEKKPAGGDIGDYLLIYSFDPWDSHQKVISDYAASHHLKTVSVGRNSTWADVSFTDASVQEWLWLFKHASCVFTDSYHGSIFSIKNRKQFIVVSRHDKINKIEDLFTQLGIEKTFYREGMSLEEYLRASIDYDCVYKTIEAEKAKSLEYLKASLEGISE